MFLDTVKKLLNQALEERQDLFLIDFKMSNDNAIKVIIDGDKGVTVEDCIFVSRAIEHNIDREEYDFSLEVMSAGAASSFNMPRQFTKHVEITLEWKSREPKPVGKGKVTVNKKQNIAFKDILEAKVIIKF